MIDMVAYYQRDGRQHGEKVRRITQLVTDLTGKAWDALTVLDLACGDGIYAVELGLQGATVDGLDIRMERMGQAIKIAAEYGLTDLSFRLADLREWQPECRYDVALVLGILYHLELSDAYRLLCQCRECSRMTVIDTHIALADLATCELDGASYAGKWYREHGEDDSAERKMARYASSYPNVRSFWLTMPSLLQLLRQAGYSSVLHCYMPPEPHKAEDRVTLVAYAGEPVQLHTCPWVDDET